MQDEDRNDDYWLKRQKADLGPLAECTTWSRATYKCLEGIKEAHFRKRDDIEEEAARQTRINDAYEDVPETGGPEDWEKILCSYDPEWWKKKAIRELMEETHWKGVWAITDTCRAAQDQQKRREEANAEAIKRADARWEEMEEERLLKMVD